MQDHLPILDAFCGKVASGKSTRATELGRRTGTVLISEDHWLHTLYGHEMHSIADYLRCMARFRSAMGPHVASLLQAGTSVVLDFQFNTKEARCWLRSILDEARAAHVLHVFDVPDEVCLARLHARNKKGDHPFAVREAAFRQITRHFVPPSAEERFNLRVYEVDATGQVAPRPE